MRSAGHILLAVILIAIATDTVSAVNLPPDFGLFTVGNTATFTKPVALAFAEDGRIFVAEQRGRIYILEPDSNAVDPRTDYNKLATPFMEIEAELGITARYAGRDYAKP